MFTKLRFRMFFFGVFLGDDVQVVQNTHVLFHDLQAFSHTIGRAKPGHHLT